MQPEVVLPDGAPTEAAEFFEQVARAICSSATSFLSDRKLAEPEVRIVAASNIMEVAAAEGERLGLQPDRRLGVERVGGVVGGKCLISDDRRHASIVVASAAAAASDAASRLIAAALLGHEVGHLIYGLIRAAEIGNFPNVWKPWDVAGMIAVLAAEEYRVDVLGQVLAERTLLPTDPSGAPVSLADISGSDYRSGLEGALDEISPKLEETISAYRLHRLSLDEMWNAMARTSEGIALYLAHTEAHTKQSALAIEGVAHRGADLLEPFWRPLFAYLQEAPIVPPAHEWSADRNRLIEIGLVGYTESWRRLGVAARPQGEAFFLSVFDPE